MEGTYEDESSGAAGTINIAPFWNEYSVETDGTDLLDEETEIVHGGSKSQLIMVDQGNEGINTDIAVFRPGNQYEVSIWIYAEFGAVNFLAGTGDRFLDEDVTPAPGEWTNYTYTFTATEYAQLIIRSSWSGGGSATFYVDDVEVTNQSTSQSVPDFIEPDENLKVAFIGDSGIDQSFISVLELIQSEEADMVLHNGDFDYSDDPDAFEATINSILGPDYPYLVTVGNHDLEAWPTTCQETAEPPGNGCYADHFLTRFNQVGVQLDDSNLDDAMYSMAYGGLKFITAYRPENNEIELSFIENQLRESTNIWTICAWHHNQTAMQVGAKEDEVGWLPYEMCKDYGAIIATAHEHSYHRTKTLVNTRGQMLHPLWPDPDQLFVAPGSSFVFVSGLGGFSIRSQLRCLPTTYPYGCNGEWASIYTSDQNANYGALFITFNVDGNPRKAVGYFKNIDGEVIDQFEIYAEPNYFQYLPLVFFSID